MSYNERKGVLVESRLASGGTLIVVAVVCGILIFFFGEYLETILEENNFLSVGSISLFILFVAAFVIGNLLVKPSKRRSKRGII